MLPFDHPALQIFQMHVCQSSTLHFAQRKISTYQGKSEIAAEEEEKEQGARAGWGWSQGAW